MATIIVLITETQEGERNIHNTVARADRFREEAAEFGVTVKDLYWTLGGFDGVLVLDAPDEETAAALLFRLKTEGNVRTQTLRAFDGNEMEAILSKASV